MEDSISELVARLRAHFQAVDEGLESLSAHLEGKTTGLPQWTLTTRRVEIGVTPDSAGVAVRIRPDASLHADEFEVLRMRTDADLHSILAPLGVDFGLRRYPRGFTVFADLRIEKVGSPLDPALMMESGMWGFGEIKSALEMFSDEKGKEEALNWWNAAQVGTKGSNSIVDEIGRVISTFGRLVKRKAFLERRIHRFLREHAGIMLPPHTRLWYEAVLTQGDEVRRADFILERESGMPPLLLELESPAVQVFRRNGELTAEANHARNQIAEWVRFIDSEQSNSAGRPFLSGPKQRLVVIGRGLDHLEQMIASRFTDTVIWTYDLLIVHAKARWNAVLSQQRELVGLPKRLLLPVPVDVEASNNQLNELSE